MAFYRLYDLSQIDDLFIVLSACLKIYMITYDYVLTFLSQDNHIPADNTQYIFFLHCRNHAGIEALG